MNPLLTIVLLFVFSLKGFSQTADQFFKTGEIKYNARKYQEAIEDYSKAIMLDSTKVNYFVRRGFCYSVQEQFDLAIQDYSVVIKLDPKHKWAYLSRGGARNKVKDFKGAIEDFNQLLVIDPKDSEAYNNRGWAKKALGDQAGACADWIKSKKMGNEEAKIILENNYCK